MQLNKNIIKLFALLYAFLIGISNSYSQDTIAFYNFDDGNTTAFTTGALGLNGDSDNRTSWEIGMPQGGQGYNNTVKPGVFAGSLDPVADYTTGNTLNYVAGQGLSTSSKKEGIAAYYSNSNEWFQTPAINCLNYFNVTLSFMQWANFEPGFDFPSVEVSNDGTTWTAVYQPERLEQTSWEQVEINIANYASNQATVYIRWRTESDEAIFYSGWNIDDVLFKGDYISNDADSWISFGSSFPLSISSTIDSYTERISIADFTISDAGSGDLLSTIIDTLVIIQNQNNTIPNWRKAIAGASLYDPESHIELVGKVEQTRIFFTNQNLLTIADGSSRNYILRIYLNVKLSEIYDKDVLGLEINYANFNTSTAGSQISSGSVSSASNELVVDIAATKLTFITEPDQLVEQNRIIMPLIEVAATDANGNIDTDYQGTIQLSNSSSLAMSNNQAALANGLASFITFIFNETGGPVRLTAEITDKSLMGAESSVTITISKSIANYVFFDNFDNSGIAGWTSGAITGSSSWQQGIPMGGQGYCDVIGSKTYIGNPDPTSDHSSNNTTNKVYGQGLAASSKFEGNSGHYNNSNEWLMSPAINCSEYYNVQLSFWRWANMEPGIDKAFVEISTDGSNWIDLGHDLYPEDITWTNVVFDISTIADRQSTVYIRWRMESNGSIFYSGWNIDDVELNGVYSPVTTWTGNSSEYWSDAQNWSTGVVPNEFSSVIIEAGTTYSPSVVSTNAYSKEILIKQGAILTVESGGTLDIFGDLTIETSSSSYGSVIDKGNINVNGNGIMTRYLSARRWYYLASPFKSTSSVLFGQNIYKYNEVSAADDWSLGWEVVLNESLMPGVGYDVFTYVNKEINMTGAFNTGNVNINLTYTDGAEVAEHEGWNLIGNPYPSAIDWDAPTGWTRTNINNAIYIWNEEQQNFVTYVGGTGANGGSQYIPPMQGFFVKVSSPGSGSINMTNEVRHNNTTVSLKSTFNYKNELKFKLTGSTYSDEAVIKLNKDATDGFDTQFDADKKFSDNSSVPQIYSYGENTNPLVINSLEETKEYRTVKLYSSLSNAGTYTLSVEGMNDFDYSKTLYLEDLVLDTLIDLNETKVYSFETDAITDSVRFVVHIGMPLTMEYAVKHVSEGMTNDGEIDLTIRGGAQPILSIEWSNGQEQPDLEGITAGTYIVVVTDYDLNTLTDTIVVLQDIGDGQLISVNDSSDSDGYDIVYSSVNTISVKTINDFVFTKGISVYDLSGRNVFQDNSPEIGSFEILHNLPEGIYILTLHGNSRIVSYKILIH
ncbi:MAG: T9SS type A sorting domain-containing protein [Bacteroidales bacterium]|nr:T9SS type A sorting domain-containing protein [Bacteroidales bacterium]MBN2819823.1 T9SS type A sorting domain-containing protein [Bacteroidales bacterium]